MNTKTSTKAAVAGILIAAGATGALPAATVAVDWLEFAAGSGPGGFSLRDDGGTAVVNGSVIVDQGVLFPSFPGTRNLLPGFWGAGVPDTENSVTGNGAVSGFEVRVVGTVVQQPAYRLELLVATEQPLYLMIGELLWTAATETAAAAATAGVRIEAFSDSGSASIDLIQMLIGYDASEKSPYDGELEWDGTTLSTVGGNDGESRFAFFGISPLAGGNAKVVLTIPQGYAGGTGDSLVFALGVAAIPEPSIALLGGLGALLLLRRRVR